ncbi:hypothetical protein BABA_01350, partial [Neobacillus bataviensis LMG 21833]
GDVYDEKDVTSDVYQDWANLYQTNESGDFELDYSNISEDLALGAFISSSEKEKILKENPNAKVIVKKGNLVVSFPLNMLPIDQDFALNILKDSKDYANSLSPVYDFIIVKDDNTFVKEFKDHPVQLKFIIDPSKVTNWDDVKVKYIDDKGVMQDEVIKIISINKTTGEVVAEVTHFSKYGVFQIASSTNTGSTDNDTSNTGYTDKGSSNNGTSNTGSTNGTASGSTSTSQTSTTTNTNSGSTNSVSTAGNTLPDTATNSFDLLALGLLLISLGGIVLFVRRKNSLKVN